MLKNNFLFFILQITLFTIISSTYVTIPFQLYKDDDGVIYLAPRHTLTDGYTIPAIFHCIVGGKFEHDIRCAIQHDWECYYHKKIVVNMTEYELRKHRFLKYKSGMWICENIPLELLTISDTTFTETNKRFMRMLKSLFNIPKVKAELIGLAVNFNIGWLREPVKLHPERLYRIDYDQLRR